MTHVRCPSASATLADIYQGFRTLRAGAATLLVASAVLLAACGGSDDDTEPRVLGVTITTTTTTTSGAEATTSTTTTSTTTASTTTTTTAPAPAAVSTGTVEVHYDALRPNATVTVELEREDGTIAQSADASDGGGTTFTADAGRYRVAITEIGRTEESDGTATSSAVTSRTELFEIAPGGTVVVQCAGNAECTIVAR